ncbi:MAG: hypothetical protein PHE84_08210 [bacterium]|nr:hypothetical protein [bacterium]
MENLKTKLMVTAAAGLLVGAVLVFACGKGKEALSTPPAEQTQIAQEASAEAIGIATQVTDMAMLFMQGGMAIGFAPQSPLVRPLAKELSWESSLTCPRQFSLDISPDGCDPKLGAYADGSCESLELQVGYAEGCTEALVWKEGEGSIKLEVIDQASLPSGTDQGFKLTVAFSDFIEGDKSQDGELTFTAASSTDGQSGQIKIETGDSGYTENGKENTGYALMTYSTNGTVKKGLTAGTATEADLTMEADITSADESGTESVDIKYVIVSDMSGGDPDSGIVTIDISGTNSEWGSLDLSGGSIQLSAQGMKIGPDCSKNPVAGTLGVKGTTGEGVTYDVLLTFHSACDQKAEAKISVEGEDVSGTFEGTIPLESAGAPAGDTILGQLFDGFTNTWSQLQDGLEQLGNRLN